MTRQRELGRKGNPKPLWTCPAAAVTMHAMSRIASIAVFCGSSSGRNSLYASAAESLGKEMAKRSITLVYGGGNRGLMGIIASAVHDAGGHVVGVLPEAMNLPSVRTEQVESELLIVTGMHERKKAMYDRAEAYIAMPGGIGTIEEIAEIYTWRQLGYHRKPVALLNAGGYWDPFISMLGKGVDEGFISDPVRNILIVESNPSALLDRIAEEDNTVLPSKLG